MAPPKARPISEAENAYYLRKKSVVAVRHVSGHRVVAVVELVSPGNKSTRNALDEFVRKAADFLNRGVHFLVIDLLPPGRHDAQGIHGAIWDYVGDGSFSLPPNRPLTLASYESGPLVRAFVESVAVGDSLPEMPLFLQPGGCVDVPLETSYRVVWEGVPRPRKDVLEVPH